MLFSALKGRVSGTMTVVATAFLWSIAGLFIKMIDWNPFESDRKNNNSHRLLFNPLEEKTANIHRMN